jgi:hypothetical protein
MDIPEIRISLKCLFCKSDLMAEEGKEYNSGDMIECLECHEMNDYDSLMEVAKEEGLERMKSEVNRAIKNKFKNLFK